MKTLTTPTKIINDKLKSVDQTTFETFQAEVIIKCLDYITGHTNKQEVFSFTGITDFTGYHLDYGEEWDTVLITAEQEQGQRILAIELGEPTPITANSLYNDYSRGWATDAQVDLAHQKGLITLQQSVAIKSGTFVVL